MKMLVCITKTAEVEIRLEEARSWVVAHINEDTSGWTPEQIAEEYVSFAEGGALDLDFDRRIQAVCSYETALPA